MCWVARFARRPVVCELDQCSELIATLSTFRTEFIMSKFFALAAFNTAVVAVNTGHIAKRLTVKAAKVTVAQSKATATASKEAGIAFWAGMKYAHQYNKAKAVAAERLTRKDIEASKPSKKSAKTRTVTKRSAK